MSDTKVDLTAFQDCLLNGKINHAKGLLASEQGEFANLIERQQSGPNYKDFCHDDLATSLILEDVRAEVDNQLVALSTTGNRDCLFNASSIMLFGNESVAALLRLLVAGELYFNHSFYADHEGFTGMITSNPELYPDVVFAVALTKRVRPPITALNKWSATCWCSMSTAGQHMPVTCWITEEKRLGAWHSSFNPF